MPKLGRQYISDIFTTLIDLKWRWILSTFAVIFTTSWLMFGCVYYLICYIHGDIGRYATKYSDLIMDAQFITKEQYQILSNYTWEPCVTEVDSFFSAFLFSVETQHTIGYGSRHVTTACLPAGLMVCIQSMCGLLIQSFLVGLVFSKMARPKKRAETLIFSEKAVISLRDSQLCLLFRVADMRMTHLVEAHIRVQLISSRTTEEGEIEPLYQHELDVGYDEGRDRIFLVWPIAVCHVIDKESPLYDLSARELLSAQFEIAVLLEGIVESTGMTAQARTSYLPSEILWGHRFSKLVTYQKYNGAYQIDYSLFHNTYPVNTPRCSARELNDMKRAGFHLGCDSEFFFKSAAEQELDRHSDDNITPSHSPDPSSLHGFLHSPAPSSIREESVSQYSRPSSPGFNLEKEDLMTSDSGCFNPLTSPDTPVTEVPKLLDVPKKRRPYAGNPHLERNGSIPVPQIVVNSPSHQNLSSATTTPDKSIKDVSDSNPSNPPSPNYSPVRRKVDFLDKSPLLRRTKEFFTKSPFSSHGNFSIGCYMSDIRKSASNDAGEVSSCSDTENEGTSEFTSDIPSTTTERHVV